MHLFGMGDVSLDRDASSAVTFDELSGLMQFSQGRKLVRNAPEGAAGVADRNVRAGARKRDSVGSSLPAGTARNQHNPSGQIRCQVLSWNSGCLEIGECSSPGPE
jgi:hypothetical protein